MYPLWLLFPRTFSGIREPDAGDGRGLLRNMHDPGAASTRNRRPRPLRQHSCPASNFRGVLVETLPRSRDAGCWRPRRAPPHPCRENAGRCRNENSCEVRCLQFAARLAARVNVRAMRGARILLKCLGPLEFSAGRGGRGRDAADRRPISACPPAGNRLPGSTRSHPQPQALAADRFFVRHAPPQEDNRLPSPRFRRNARLKFAARLDVARPFSPP